MEALRKSDTRGIRYWVYRKCIRLKRITERIIEETTWKLSVNLALLSLSIEHPCTIILVRPLLVVIAL